MSVIYTPKQYYASNYLVYNTNATALPGPTNNDTLTEWLKNSYNATITETTDISELLSQLQYNAGFNPYDSIDNYITGLEKNPLGNAINDVSAPYVLSDNDYYMYTLSNVLKTITTTGVPSLPPAFTIQDGNNYFDSAANLNLYKSILDGSAAMGPTVSYYEKTGSTYNFCSCTKYEAASYSKGIVIDDDGYISSKDAANDKLTQEVADFITNNGAINGVSINTLTTTPAHVAKLIEMYKQLTEELQGLKEYTLSNQEIIDMQAEIDALNGAGVKGNLENKIKNAQDELRKTFSYQLQSINTNTSNASAGLFNKGTDSEIAKAVSPTISQIGTKVGTNWVYAGITSSDPNLAIPADVVISKELFNKDAVGPYNTYDFVNNPFYEYTVSLRTDSKLEFEKSFNEAIPEWNADKGQIKKDNPGGFDPSNYSNVEENTDKLGPIEILKNLYSTQELLALYKQYEDAQNKANSMTLALNTALQTSAEFDFRKVLAEKVLAQLLTIDPLATLQLSTEMGIAKTIERGCSTGPSAQKNTKTSTPTFDGFYGDINTGSTTNETVLVDPYLVTINGTKYVLGQDSNSNGNIDDVSEILGINDSMDNPFKSLASLDTNKDGFVSKDEFLANHIVLKALDSSDKLTNTSFDTSLIAGVDLSKVDKTSNGNIAGTFSLKLANGTTAQGVQTFDDQGYFNNLFGKIVDLKPYQTSTSEKTSTTKSETEKTETTETTKQNQTISSTSTSHQTLLQQINNAYNALIIDDTSNIETILNNVCWKHSVLLTPAQRLRIIDGIDPLAPVYDIEKKIITAVSNLNISA